MKHFSESIIREYYLNVKKANSELAKKELLKDLLVRLFDKDKTLHEIINKMSLGAEKTVFNIPLEDRTKTGSADTQYGKVIIEFEKNLNLTEEHAKNQLVEYVAGNWKSGENYNFTLISTDCLKWKIYAPELEGIINKNNNLSVSDIELKEIDSYEIDDRNLNYFPYFLDRYLFRTEKIKATYESIQNDFGESSQVFFTCFGIMKFHFIDSDNPELNVAYEQWNKFLSIAYGKFEASKEVFFVHTYLSVFAKILAYTIITKDIYIDDVELKGILVGNIFNKYNVQNFVDDDFFHWVSSKNNFKLLKDVFRQITQKIDEYDFTDVREDILKGVYQELIDLETRHALGEYYTPDWLCKRIVDKCNLKRDSRVLDPACGSGSFIQATVSKLKDKFPGISIEEITNQITGIDIHPLSVQIAKTTLLLSIQDKLQEAKRPIFLGIYLANTLIIPVESVKLFRDTYKMLIDKKQYAIETTIFDNAGLFDDVVSLCNELAEYSKDSKIINKKDFRNNLLGKKLLNKLNDLEVDSFYKIYSGFKEAKESGRDSIWKFIVQNLYKPFFLNEKFDFVIGNPPWITYSSFSNSTYQDLLYELAEKYNLIPISKANMPHLEIASIFLAYSASYFLKKNGKIIFVLPRSFLSADHHDNTRSGRAEGFKLTEIWDLKDVKPLFRVPSIVMFADKHDKQKSIPRKLPEGGIKGLRIGGNLKHPNANIEHTKKLIAEKVKWYFSKLGKTSAITNKKIKRISKKNYYQEYFKQGATIVPRNFYFVEPEQLIPKDGRDRLIQFKTSEIIIKDAKPPWKYFTFSGRVNTNFLFKTALSKNIVPFSFINPPFVILPIKIRINKSDGMKSIMLLSSNDILKMGELETARWFKKSERLWNKNKTEKNRGITSYNYLNWQNKIILQDLNFKHLVLYTASSKDANSVVISRSDFLFDFIVESKAYWFGTNNLREAIYVSCFLNSNYTNNLIKDFQSRGLFGARDVHKKILEIPFPKFDFKNSLHTELSKLGKVCMKKAKTFIGDDTEMDLSPSQLGRLRLSVREHLKKEFKEIDKIVKVLVEN